MHTNTKSQHMPLLLPGTLHFIWKWFAGAGSYWPTIAVNVLRISRLLGRFYLAISMLTNWCSVSLIVLFIVFKKLFDERFILILLAACLLLYSFFSIQTHTINILLPFNWLQCIKSYFRCCNWSVIPNCCWGKGMLGSVHWWTCGQFWW